MVLHKHTRRTRFNWYNIVLIAAM